MVFLHILLEVESQLLHKHRIMDDLNKLSKGLKDLYGRTESSYVLHMVKAYHKCLHINELHWDHSLFRLDNTVLDIYASYSSLFDYIS